MSISGMKLAEVTRESIMREMNDSEFQFHLTGSRFFQTNRNDSDYDFFVQDSVSVREFLYTKGFRPHVISYEYKDSQILIAFCHPTGIDVQCVRNVDVKLIAQSIIRDMGLHREVMKNSLHEYKRVQVWTRAYKVAEWILLRMNAK